MPDHIHTSHPAIVKRLKRADGHLKSVIEMIVEGHSCHDIAQQLHAVERAIQAAKKTLIHDHLDHCLADTLTDGGTLDRREVDAFRKITRDL